MYVHEKISNDDQALEVILFHATQAEALAAALADMMASPDEIQVVVEEGSFFFSTRDKPEDLKAVIYEAELAEPGNSFQARLAQQMLESGDVVESINAFLRHVRTQVGHA